MPHRLCLALLLFFAASATAGEKPAKPSDYRFPLSQIRVIDGDTLEGNLALPLKLTLRRQRVRLLGADTWEPRGAEREKGLKAKAYVEKVLATGTVWIVLRRDRRQRDNFGRILGEVWVRTKTGWLNLAAGLKAHGHIKPRRE